MEGDGGVEMNEACGRKPRRLETEKRTDDPVERQVEHALDRAGLSYERNKEIEPGRYSIDFYLPDLELWIEVCQFYTPRKIEQLSHIDNVILIQGMGAAVAFTKMLEPGVVPGLDV